MELEFVTSKTDTSVTFRSLRFNVTDWVFFSPFTVMLATPVTVQSLKFGANHKTYETGLVFSGNRNTSIFSATGSPCPRTRAHSSAADRNPASLNMITGHNNVYDGFCVIHVMTTVTNIVQKNSWYDLATAWTNMNTNHRRPNVVSSPFVVASLI